MFKYIKKILLNLTLKSNVLNFNILTNNFFFALDIKCLKILSRWMYRLPFYYIFSLLIKIFLLDCSFCELVFPYDTVENRNHYREEDLFDLAGRLRDDEVTFVLKYKSTLNQRRFAFKMFHVEDFSHNHVSIDKINSICKKIVISNPGARYFGEEFKYCHVHISGGTSSPAKAAMGFGTFYGTHWTPEMTTHWNNNHQTLIMHHKSTGAIKYYACDSSCPI